jgi:sodium-dependent dicarboxylate transporter 2/3/5
MPSMPALLRKLSLPLGPLLAALAYALCLQRGLDGGFAATVAVTVWCACWWLLEPVEAPVTALLPVLLLPLAGVLDAKQVAQSLGHELIVLLGAGFMLSRGLEKSGAHRRLALGMVRAFGGNSGRRLLFGFIAATGFFSLWISNTATTLLMLPIALAILETYPDRRLHVPLVLGIAYAASIGGMGTPIGSPPNLVFREVYAQTTGVDYGFAQWMSIGIPVVALFLPLMGLWLGRRLGGAPPAGLPEVGAWRRAERRVLGVFGLIALLWIFRTEPLGGWSGLLHWERASDALVAVFGVLLLSLLPDGEGERLLTWKSAERIPWGALLLFGGGIALATGFEKSGVSDAIARGLTGLRTLPLPLLLPLLIAGVVALSEIASNTATAVLLMPILAATGLALGIDPALLMFPAVLAASVGFMLPVATAPNAIAYGTGHVDARTMLREGFALDLIGVAVLSLVCWIAFV